MLVTTAICFLLGAGVGLKFNVKMLGNTLVATTLFWILAAAFATTSIGNAALEAIISAVALQSGYFVSLLVGALGLAEGRGKVLIESPAKVKQFELPQELQKRL